MEFGVACSSDYFSPALCPLSEALQEPETGLETSCRWYARNPGVWSSFGARRAHRRFIIRREPGLEFCVWVSASGTG